jgi:hypothetical protein
MSIATAEKIINLSNVTVPTAGSWQIIVKI